MSFILFSLSQRQWLPELILMTFENVTTDSTLMTDSTKAETIKQISEIENRNVLVMISEKLQDENQNLTFEIFSNILKSSEMFTLETLDFLEDLDLDAWKFAITDNYWDIKVQKVLKTPKSSKLVAFHFAKLQVQYGTEIVNKLLTILETKIGDMKISERLLVMVLAAFSNNEVALTDEVLEKLSKNRLGDWLKKYELDGESNKLRSAENVMNMIKDVVPLNSEKGLTKKNVFEIYNMTKKLYAMKNIKKFTESDIKSWRGRFTTSVDPIETLAVIVRAFEIAAQDPKKPDQKVHFRYPCIATILMFWKSKMPLLAQVATGEGKTWIGVSFAVMKVLYGDTVDIITSSNLLATRDAEDSENTRVHGMFNIVVGHNCSEDIEQRKKVYQTAHVIYGSLGNFQRDFLLDKFYNKNITNYRSRTNVIVDEVDSMLLDKGEILIINIGSGLGRSRGTSVEYEFNLELTC